MWQQYLGFFPLSTNPWYFCKGTELGRMFGKTEITTAARQHPDASSGTRGASSRRWDSLSSYIECVSHTARVRESETSKTTREVSKIPVDTGRMAEIQSPWDGWKWAMRKGPQGKRESYLHIIVISVCLTLSLGDLLLGKAVNYHGPDENKTRLFNIQELFNLSEAFTNKKSYKASLANWSLAIACQSWLVDTNLWGK